jgi:hypothetical protein
MTYNVEFIATRHDTSKPFFYEAPEYSYIMDEVENILAGLAEINAINDYTQHTSEDLLTHTRKMIFPNRDLFMNYLGILNIKFPDIMIIRNQYFLDNSHSLLLKWSDGIENLDGSYVLVP